MNAVRVTVSRCPARRRPARPPAASAPHGVEERVHRGRVEVRDPEVVAAHQLVGHRGGQEPDRGPGPRLRGDDDSGAPRPSRRPAWRAGGRSRRRRPSRSPPGSCPAPPRACGPRWPWPRRPSARCRRRRAAAPVPKSGPDVALDGAAGEVEVEPQAPLGEGVGVEIAGHGVGIGHRRPIRRRARSRRARDRRPRCGARRAAGRARRRSRWSRRRLRSRSSPVTGIRTGRPLPLMNRSARPTSNAREVRGWPSSMRHTFAVVPPMSKDSARGGTFARAGDPGGEDRAAARPRLDRAGRGTTRAVVQRRHAAAGGHQEERAVEARRLLRLRARGPSR